MSFVTKYLEVWYWEAIDVGRSQGLALEEAPPFVMAYLEERIEDWLDEHGYPVVQ